MQRFRCINVSGNVVFVAFRIHATWERDMQWSTLKEQTQNLYLRLLWQDRHSDKAIADFFGTTKNVIVRRRWTLELLSSGRVNAKQAVDSERFRDLLDLYAIEKMEEEKGVAVIAPIGTCEWPLSSSPSLRKLQYCGAPVLPEQRLCEEHSAVAHGFTRGRS